MNKIHQKKSLYILVTSDEPNNVVLGHAAFALQAGLDPVFVFPYRKQTHNIKTYYKNYKTIRLNFMFENDGVVKYLISNIKYAYHVFGKFENSNNKILAVDLTGVMAAAFLKMKGNKIYVLVNDNFSARYKLPRIFFNVLRWFESMMYKAISEICIFPSKSRYELLGSPKLKSIEYLPNVLEDNITIRWVGSTDKEFRVLLCGWLVKSRGLDILNQIIANTDETIQFILMGSGDNEAINKISECKRVQYISHGTRKETLNEMSKVDINLALYDPEIMINRYALPQKIYDALLIGCPILINSEVQLSEELSENELCIKAPYKNPRKIADIINYYGSNKSDLKIMSEKILKYNKENYNYNDISVKGIEIYSRITG